jgi:hypothetical protein
VANPPSNVGASTSINLTKTSVIDAWSPVPVGGVFGK